MYDKTTRIRHALSLGLRAACIAGLLHTSGLAQAVPPWMNFQGRVLIAGQAFDGSKDMAFRIFGSEAGADVLWSETQSAVPVDNGVFSVRLGSQTPLDDAIFAAPSLYLEIEVDGKILPPASRSRPAPTPSTPSACRGRTSAISWSRTLPATWASGRRVLERCFIYSKMGIIPLYQAVLLAAGGAP
ncbi:MAG: hypothetical protein ABII00_04845 [Elusimicrobiota bacterium]